MLACRRILAAALAGALASSASAADLVQAWEAASRNDREFAVARAARAAADPRLALAEALWRPSVGVTAVAGIGASETSVRGARFSAPGFGASDGVAFDTSVTNASSTRLALAAVQPVYNPEKRAQQRLLAISVEAAEAEFEASRKSLMLRTAQRWFELALAEEAARVSALRLEAVRRASVEAEDRFALGSIPVTGTHEARASLASVRAELVAAEAEAQTRREQLADSTGLPEGELAPMLPDGGPVPPDGGSLDRWLSAAEDGNPELRLRRVAVEAARQEAAKFTLAAAPTVDLVAQATRERISGSGDFGGASSTATNHLVGLKATIPLHTGGHRDAKSREALALVDKASAERERARQEVRQQVRATWRALAAGALRASALAEGLAAATSRRDATRTGVEVGHRTTQDLLDAESDLAAMRLALSRSRVAVLLDRLRLEMLAGSLDEDGLRRASAR